MEREPDLELGGLSLWVLGRERPSSRDVWDSGWLNIHAQVQAPGAVVTARGPWIRVDELSQFTAELERLHRELSGSATLDCIEPALRARVEALALGQLRITVELTPDHMTQEHRFRFESDQSYLPTVLNACRRILRDYPERTRPAD